MNNNNNNKATQIATLANGCFWCSRQQNGNEFDLMRQVAVEHIGSRIRKEDRADDIERLVNLIIKYGQISNTEYN